jgi:hypothetical protein
MAAGVRVRWLVLGSALALTLAAARLVGGADRAPPERAEAPADRPARAAAATDEPVAELALDKLGARSAAPPAADPFRPISWQALAQAEARRHAPPPAPRRPEAPPLPFAYMGKLVEDGRTTVFLVHGERNLIVRTGDTIDGTYRVDRIGEDDMTLTYLPLQQRQELALGGTQ